jgi:hypothetical protein
MKKALVCYPTDEPTLAGALSALRGGKYEINSNYRKYYIFPRKAAAFFEGSKKPDILVRKLRKEKGPQDFPVFMVELSDSVYKEIGGLIPSVRQAAPYRGFHNLGLHGL